MVITELKRALPYLMVDDEEMTDDESEEEALEGDDEEDLDMSGGFEGEEES